MTLLNSFQCYRDNGAVSGLQGLLTATLYAALSVLSEVEPPVDPIMVYIALCSPYFSTPLSTYGSLKIF